MADRGGADSGRAGFCERVTSVQALAIWCAGDFLKILVTLVIAIGRSPRQFGTSAFELDLLVF